VTDTSRITELRRRVEADPASIAFAQLAEEYRRAGDLASAEQWCRSGLAKHPGYGSARVTLGRTLIERGKLDEAEAELQVVLRSAPENLAAIRGLADIHQQRGELAPALGYYLRALPLAQGNTEIEAKVKQLSRELDRLAGGTAAPSVAATPPAPEPDAADKPTVRLPAKPVSAATDFDGLLDAFGTPDRAAPSIIESLLAQPPATPQPNPVLTDLPMETAAGDPFADLELGLRRFDESRADLAAQSLPPSHFEETPVDDEKPTVIQRLEPIEPEALGGLQAPQAPSAAKAADQSMLDELEAWLSALKR
jgi:tetratricopeptide (TPR) repeat protein